MREEITKVLNLVANGAVNVPQAMDLLDAIGVFDERVEQVISPSGAKLVCVNVESYMGDELNLKLPVAMFRSAETATQLVKRYLKPGDALYDKVEQAFITARELLDSGAIGELINVCSHKGDELHISIN